MNLGKLLTFVSQESSPNIERKSLKIKTENDSLPSFQNMLKAR